MILWTSISVCGPNKKNCSIYPRPVGLSCCKTRRARRSSLVGVAWKPHACMPHGQNLVRSTNFTSFGDSTLYLYEYIEHMKHTCAAWWKWWCAWVKSKWYNFWSVCCNLVTCVCVCDLCKHEASELKSNWWDSDKSSISLGKYIVGHSIANISKSLDVSIIFYNYIHMCMCI